MSKNTVSRPQRISVAYNGINYDLFDISKADRPAIREMLNLKDNFVYMYFGRPGISKGVEYLIAAVPLISQEIPNSRLLLLLGKEPAEGYKKMLALIKEMQIEEPGYGARSRTAYRVARLHCRR